MNSNGSDVIAIKDRVLQARWFRDVAIVILLSCLATLGGPFGTSETLAVGPRFLYWLGMIALGWAQWGMLTRLIHRLTRANPWPSGAVGTVASFFFAALMALELFFLHRVLPLPPVPQAAATFLWIVVVMLSMCWLVQLIAGLLPSAGAPSTTTADAGSEARFMRRIPRRIAGELLCVKTEDHYLRLFTTAGTDLILFRLKDALPELEGIDGMQVHRSYWVASSAVESAEKKGRRPSLVLKNGLKVPVSETYLPAVRTAGWLG